MRNTLCATLCLAIALSTVEGEFVASYDTWSEIDQPDAATPILRQLQPKQQVEAHFVDQGEQVFEKREPQRELVDTSETIRDNKRMEVIPSNCPTNGNSKSCAGKCEYFVTPRSASKICNSRPGCEWKSGLFGGRVTADRCENCKACAAYFKQLHPT